MGEIKILTPIQLWANYNPVKQPLDISFNDVRSDGRYITKSMFITAEDAEDGKVRAYVKVVYPPKDTPAPAVLFIPSAETKTVSEEFIKEILDKGCIFATFDYAGESKGKEFFTSYPDSMAYGQYSGKSSLVNLDNFDGCEKTPWFIWTKIARRVLTLLCSDPKVDCGKIALIGMREGASIGWKVAGTDGRISMFASVIGCGYYGYGGNKFSDAPPKELSVAQVSFLAGMASQSYAKTVMCPVYLLMTTNNLFSDVDRAGDILKLTASHDKSLVFTPGASDSINTDSYNSLMLWLYGGLLDAPLREEPPKSTFYSSDGRLYLSINVTGEAQSAEVFTAYDEAVPELRNWERAGDPLMISATEYLLDLDIPEGVKKIFAFVTVKYKSGMMLSTEIVSVSPDALGVTEYSAIKQNRQRLIYSSSAAGGAFYVENDHFSKDENRLSVTEGPFGIKGIGSSKGHLVSYRLGDANFMGEDGYILQADAYAKAEKEIVITMYTYEQESFKAFAAVRKLPESGRWQRINFTVSEFKSAERISLKSWKLVKKFEISDAEGVIFNNILWV